MNRDNSNENKLSVRQGKYQSIQNHLLQEKEQIAEAIEIESQYSGAQGFGSVPVIDSGNHDMRPARLDISNNNNSVSVNKEMFYSPSKVDTSSHGSIDHDNPRKAYQEHM